MTPNRFRATLQQLGLNYEEPAKALGTSWRSVAGYATGRKIPEPVARLLALHLEVQSLRAELKRAKRKEG